MRSGIIGYFPLVLQLAPVNTSTYLEEQFSCRDPLMQIETWPCIKKPEHGFTLELSKIYDFSRSSFCAQLTTWKRIVYSWQLWGQHDIRCITEEVCGQYVAICLLKKVEKEVTSNIYTIDRRN
jgi:hypothetical protein